MTWQDIRRQMVKIDDVVRNFVLLPWMLAACTGPINLTFDNPKILRGVWQSIDQTQSSIRLELVAIYVNTEQYQVSGIIKIGDTVSTSIQGNVYGGNDHRFVQPKTPIPMSSTADLFYKVNELNHNLVCRVTKPLDTIIAQPIMQCALRIQGSPDVSLNLQKQ